MAREVVVVAGEEGVDVAGVVDRFATWAQETSSMTMEQERMFRK